MAGTPKRIYKELTLKEKVEFIKASPSWSQRSLSEQFKIGKTQVGNILRRKAEYLTAYEKINRVCANVYVLEAN